jgi:hypothetical protein
MKLIQTKLARSIWLFDIRDLNPKGKDLIGDLIAWINERYGFAVAPDPDNPVPNPAPPSAPTSQQSPPAPQSPGGLIFQRGSFEGTEKETFVEIVALTIYDDGIVVDTASSTEDGDRFADDLLGSAAHEFKLVYDQETVRRRLYLSQLIVRSEMDLASLNPSLAAFAQKLPPSFDGGPQLLFGVGSLAFWSEPNDAGLHRAFKIERQLGRAFAEQRFFSEALMKTRIHFEYLEEFEKVVMGT